MTDDYKQTLLKYLTGKLDTQTGTNEPQFGTITESENNIKYQIAEELNVDYSKIYFHQQLYNANYETFLILGVNTDPSPQETFIAVVNKDMELVQYINTFNDNSSFFNILCLNQDENGYIYGVSNDSGTVRVLLFNNIFSSGLADGEYKAILRTSYIVPSNLNFKLVSINGSRQRIIKSQGEAIYFLTGYDSQTTSTTKVIKFQINVGSSNTWDLYTISNSFIGQSDFTVLLQKNGDNLEYNLYAINAYNVDDYTYVEYNLSSSGTWTLNKSITMTGHIYIFASQVLALNSEQIYVVADRLDTAQTTIYKVGASSLDQIYVSDGYIDTDNSVSTPIIYLRNINNNIFVYESQGIQNSYHKQKIGMIIGTDVYIEEIGQVDAQNLFSTRVDCLITNQYNLYNINVISDMNLQGQTSDYVNKYCALVYNSNNYNGLPYEATNSLIPNSSILYDFNDNVIFARNLYNKTVAGQTTTSTVQIPNTLLNDETIAQSNLIGQTNMELVNDDTEITKNIYETVNINFANTILIRNDNDVNNKVLNPTGAARLNDSTSQTMDYTNAQATKIKINYSDGTSLTILLDDNQITVVDDTTMEYAFTIYVSKSIDNIQIISHDESTVYQTINNPSLTVGKLYTLTQTVEVM